VIPPLLAVAVVLGVGCRTAKRDDVHQSAVVQDAVTAPPKVAKPDAAVDRTTGAVQRPGRSHDARNRKSIARKKGASMLFVTIIGPREKFDGLDAIDGIMPNDHGTEKLPDGTWAYSTYAYESTLDQIRALGLQVEIVQTAAEVQREMDRIDRQGQ
jgi:hypothetical protein